MPEVPILHQPPPASMTARSIVRPKVRRFARPTTTAGAVSPNVLMVMCMGVTSASPAQSRPVDFHTPGTSMTTRSMANPCRGPLDSSGGPVLQWMGRPPDQQILWLRAWFWLSSSTACWLGSTFFAKKIYKYRGLISPRARTWSNWLIIQISLTPRTSGR